MWVKRWTRARARVARAGSNSCSGQPAKVSRARATNYNLWFSLPHRIVQTKGSMDCFRIDWACILFVLEGPWQENVEVDDGYLTLTPEWISGVRKCHKNTCYMVVNVLCIYRSNQTYGFFKIHCYFCKSVKC